MYPYLFTFIITLILSSVLETRLKERSYYDIGDYILAALIILIPSILAGCRDYNVGTDIHFYALNVFKLTDEYMSWDDAIRSDAGTELDPIEIGYIILARIGHFLSDDPHILLFLTSLFINFFVFASLNRMRRYCSFFVGEFVFLFCCYNETLNLMRQSMAMVMIVYATTFLLTKEKSIIKFVVIFILAYFFHHSVGIGLIILIPIFVFKEELYHVVLTRKNWWKLVVLSICVIIISYSFFYIANYFIGLNSLWEDRYTHYITTDESGGIGIKGCFLYLFPYLILFLRRKRVRFTYIFLSIAIIDTVLYPLRIEFYYLYRISEYFFYFRILSLSMLSIKLSSTAVKKQDTILRRALYVIIILFWLFKYGAIDYERGGQHTIYKMYGDDETMPYSSKMLNIDR